MNNHELKKFGITLAILFGGFFGFVLPWIKDWKYPTWPWIISAALVILALVAPIALKPVEFIWGKIGHVLGWINTRIILSIIFFLVLTPTGLIRRCRKNPTIPKGWNKDLQSYRKISDTIHNMETPY